MVAASMGEVIKPWLGEATHEEIIIIFFNYFFNKKVNFFLFFRKIKLSDLCLNLCDTFVFLIYYNGMLHSYNKKII